MSSIDLVVFRNSALGKQVLQETVNNAVNITNNSNQNVRREIIIVRKKKFDSPTVSVTSLVRGVESDNVLVKKPRIRESSGDEGSRTPTPLAVARRNARERNRVRQVNDGFAALRRHIPEEVASAFEGANTNRGPNKKLSKVETLRMAVEYIRNLESLLNIGHADKENGTRPSMESFPSPASSSPRDNSQERSYYSINSPALEDEDMDEDEIDGSLQQISQQQYVELQSAETFQLVSTPHLYEEDDGSGQPLTPSSDLISQDDVNTHLLEGHFPFPNSTEQFTVIPEQSYINESDVPINETDFEVKYADTMHQQIHGYVENTMPLEAINPDLILSHEEYKFKEQQYIENQEYNDLDLKKELPDIQVTPEDREQFEETLKWWQEKTRQVRCSKNGKTN